jgi:hypothetical protein
VYEELFTLKYHGQWSFFEAYNLPVVIRRWFINRLVQQKEEEKKMMEEAQNKNK